MSWNKEQCIQSLSFPEDELPTAALTEALAHYQELKEDLHQAISLSPDEINRLSKEKGIDYLLQFYAFYIVAEKRDEQALPLICSFLAKHGQAAAELLGDLVTEHLDKILASVGIKNPQYLFEASQLPNLGDWVAGAYLDALAILMQQGFISREQLTSWYITLLNDPSMDKTTLTSIAFTCSSLGLYECKPVLLKLSADDKFLENSIPKDEILELQPNTSINADDSNQFQLVDDAVALLQTWDRSVPSVANYNDYLYTFSEQLQLQAIQHKHPDFGAAYMHGFLFSVVFTPDMIMPSEWTSPLLDGLDFEDKSDLKHVMETAMLVYNRLQQDRLEGNMLCPLQIDHGKMDMDYFDIAAAWCDGFLNGIRIRPQYWLDLDDIENENGNVTDLNVAWSFLMILTKEECLLDMLRDSGKKDTDQNRTQLLAEAFALFPTHVNTMVEHAQQQEAAPAKPIQSTKVGRNEPCPCGSGKKFKKCCGNTLRVVH